MRETLFAINTDKFTSEAFGGDYAVREYRSLRDTYCGTEEHRLYPGKQITFWKDSMTGNVYCVITDNNKGKVI